mmetsp:Transcript_15718/g.29226  ORF Transcript_15718/g.29226 Transcript_15718/m.29226 type:complete len:100 (-) Transcript_15718:51-350(-)
MRSWPVMRATCRSYTEEDREAELPQLIADLALLNVRLPARGDAASDRDGAAEDAGVEEPRELLPRIQPLLLFAGPPTTVPPQGKAALMGFCIASRNDPS